MHEDVAGSANGSLGAAPVRILRVGPVSDLRLDVLDQGLETFTVSTRDLNSTVPTHAEGSMGVNRK